MQQRDNHEGSLLRAALCHLCGEQRALLCRDLQRAQRLDRLLHLGGQRRVLLRGELPHMRVYGRDLLLDTIQFALLFGAGKKMFSDPGLALPSAGPRRLYLF